MRYGEKMDPIVVGECQISRGQNAKFSNNSQEYYMGSIAVEKQNFPRITKIKHKTAFFKHVNIAFDQWRKIWGIKTLFGLEHIIETSMLFCILPRNTVLAFSFKIFSYTRLHVHIRVIAKLPSPLWKRPPMVPPSTPADPWRQARRGGGGSVRANSDCLYIYICYIVYHD